MVPRAASWARPFLIYIHFRTYFDGMMGVQIFNKFVNLCSTDAYGIGLETFKKAVSKTSAQSGVRAECLRSTELPASTAGITQFAAAICVCVCMCVCLCLFAREHHICVCVDLVMGRKG